MKSRLQDYVQTGEEPGFMAQRKNGTYVLVMSYNQTDLRYYDPTNGKSVKANRKKLESEFKQAGSVYYGYAN